MQLHKAEKRGNQIWKAKCLVPKKLLLLLIRLATGLLFLPFFLKSKLFFFSLLRITIIWILIDQTKNKRKTTFIVSLVINGEDKQQEHTNQALEYIFLFNFFFKICFNKILFSAYHWISNTVRPFYLAYFAGFLLSCRDIILWGFKN